MNEKLFDWKTLSEDEKHELCELAKLNTGRVWHKGESVIPIKQPNASKTGLGWNKDMDEMVGCVYVLDHEHGEYSVTIPHPDRLFHFYPEWLISIDEYEQHLGCNTTKDPEELFSFLD